MKANLSAKELPNDIYAEKALIGCLLIDARSFDSITDLSLTKDDFYHPHYAEIFDVIRELHFSSEPTDFVTVCSKLRDKGKLDLVGGSEAISNIIDEQASPVNMYYYAKNIKDKSLLRFVIRTASKTIENGMAFNGEIKDFLTQVEGDFFKLTSEGKRTGLQELQKVLRVVLKDLENDKRKPGEISGIKTGFYDLDNKLMGMQPGQLIIIAARPGMGKTALALNIATNVVKDTKLPVAVFSLEMLANELVMRVVCSEVKIDSRSLKMKQYNNSDLKKLVDFTTQFSSYPFLVDDTPGITLIDIRSQCRKIKAEQGLGLVVIDYLQLMQSHTNAQNREQQISEISRGLKALAKELECPIISLAQLNRATEGGADKKPLVSHLRESGSIEQDADCVLLIYRDDYYNPNTQTPGVAEIIIGKNRAGETGSVNLRWIGSMTKFENLESRYE